MKEKAWHYGCLFCRTGAEATIAGYINRMMPEIESVAPIRTRRKTVDGKSSKIRYSCCPDTSSSEPKWMNSLPN